MAKGRVMLWGAGNIWLQPLERFASAFGMPALFVDRDGLLVEDPGYLHRPCDVKLVEGAVELLAYANARTVPVVLVSNQSGIGRGLYRWEDFAAVNERMTALLAGRGARLDAILACGAAPDPGSPRHHWRKPAPGMIEAAAGAFAIDLKGSWMVGDRFSDMRTARSAGIAGGMLVRRCPGLFRSMRADDGFRLFSASTLRDLTEQLNLSQRNLFTQTGRGAA